MLLVVELTHTVSKNIQYYTIEVYKPVTSGQ